MDLRSTIRIAGAASLLFLLAAMGDAFGQRLLVRTSGLTATLEAARVYLTSVDMALGTALPTGESLPGTSSTAPVVLTPDSSTAVVASTGPFPGGVGVDPTISFLSAYNTSPFVPLPMEHAVSKMGWRQTPGTVAIDPAAGAPVLALLGTKNLDNGTWQGRLEIVSLASGPSEPVGRVLFSEPLPGPPVAAVAIPTGERVAVLCGGSLGVGSYLHVVDVSTQEVVVDAKELTMPEDRHLGSSPVALAITPNGRYLVALTTGYALDRPSGSESTAVHVWSLPELSPVAGPFELPGAPGVRVCGSY